MKWGDLFIMKDRFVPHNDENSSGYNLRNENPIFILFYATIKKPLFRNRGFLKSRGNN